MTSHIAFHVQKYSGEFKMAAVLETKNIVQPDLNNYLHIDAMFYFC